jgi:type I restriction enzyme, S subunit
MTTLKSCCDFQEGYVNPSQKIADYFGGDIKWLRASDLNGAYVHTTERMITDKGLKSAGVKSFIFEENTIAISKSGTIAELGILKNKMYGNRAVINIKVNKDKADLYYIFYLLKYKNEELKKKAFGSIQKNLYVSALETLELTHKDLSYQKKIAKTLFPIFSKIENNRAINEELKKIVKTIFDYWFIQFDYPNSKGDPYKKNGGKMIWNKILNREIPYDWTVGTFKDILTKIESGDRPHGGITKISDGIPSIGAENIITIGEYNFNQEKLIPKSFFNKMKSGIIESGDVLMYKDGLNLGRVSMFKNNFPYNECCINSHAFILRTNEKISQNYLYFWLDQDFIKKLIISTGMRAAQPGINQTDVLDFPILVPERKIIDKFEKIINSKIKMIFNNANENKLLTDQENLLLPMIMNDQINIS